MPTLKNSKLEVGKLTIYVGLSATAVQFISSLFLVEFLVFNATSAFILGSILAIATKLAILSKVFKIKTKLKDQLVYAAVSLTLIILFNLINQSFTVISNSELVVLFCVLSSGFSFVLSFFLNQFMTNRSLIGS